jgi:prevent-host-death family protein
LPGEERRPYDKECSSVYTRTQFGQIIERVSRNNERFVVTKKGEAKAIILGVEDFLQAVAEPSESLSALQSEAKKSGADKLTLEEIEKEIDEVRRYKQKKEYDAHMQYMTPT